MSPLSDFFHILWPIPSTNSFEATELVNKIGDSQEKQYEGRSINKLQNSVFPLMF